MPGTGAMLQYLYSLYMDVIMFSYQYRRFGIGPLWSRVEGAVIKLDCVILNTE
jgi:hypothetical protein